ncbi:pseudaminic acid synthase [Thalassospira lucentensis]|uniref:pseudaminic acid synthase n=1 Tax=Thalassospira lucentensis TaxID=168935 RepID=UPI00399D6082
MFKIEERFIGREFEPYVIAELSANHNGSFARAKESILAAKRAGAHAVKLQTYTADTMTIDCDRPEFMMKGGLWNGYNLYDLYREAHTPFEWHKGLFEYANEIGITIFSSPFDETAVDLLQSLNAPAYKIASFELTDHPLIECIAQAKKPLLMSTGMASEIEIGEAVEVARSCGVEQILLFHCISCYPAPTDQCNLKNILYLKREFNVEVGLSDHTLNNTAAIAAVALGAVAIEKHFTLSRAEKGPDSAFSLEPDELNSLIEHTEEAWLALGQSGFGRAGVENSNKAFRRSLYFVRDVKAGTQLTDKDVRRIRPGFGLEPKHYAAVIGKKVKCDVSRGEPVQWDVLDD